METPIKFYKIGGCVRDEIMGLKPKDTDFSVEAPSFDMMKEAILSRGGVIFLEKPEFLTIRAKMEMGFNGVNRMETADFVLCRKDGHYLDGRRPTWVQPGTIFDDLARRDFTINAMAIDCRTGEVLDPHNGRKDIRERQIRCVGNPIERFNEDKLRIFRAIRFAITKKFGIEPETARAMDLYRSKDFDGVSTERIREELFKCFSFDTFRTIDRIRDDFPELAHIMNERGIWLKPTTESK